MIKHSIVFAALLLGPSPPLSAGYDCQSSISDYRQSLIDIRDRMRAYVACLEDHKNLCIFEFARLQAAHDDRDHAISGIKINCRD